MAFLKEKDICELFDCIQDDFLNVDLRDVCYHLDRDGEEEVHDQITDDLDANRPIQEGLIDGDAQVSVVITPKRSVGMKGEITIDIAGVVGVHDFSMVEEEYNGEINDYWDDLEKDMKEVMRKYVRNCVEDCEHYFHRGTEFESFEITQSFVKGRIENDVEDAAAFSIYIEIEYEML